MDQLFYPLNTVAHDYSMFVVHVGKYMNGVDANCSDVVVAAAVVVVVVFDRMVE